MAQSYVRSEPTNGYRYLDDCHAATPPRADRQSRSLPWDAFALCVVTESAQAAYFEVLILIDERGPMNISAKRALATGESSGIGFEMACAIWVATMALASAAAWSAENDGAARVSRAPVVVELFQSQGCSDCPPAQEDLNRLADSPNILALSYGVTYWDHLGWKDSFASPQFTQRQVDYSARNHGIGVATPQYWINGRQTVLGANTLRVSQLIDQADLSGGPPLSVAGSNLTVGAGDAPRGGADVWLIRYDPRTIQVAIRAGENGGRTIPHRDVVRQLIRIGRWSGTPQTIVLPGDAADGLKSAVLVQAGAGGPILAATKF